MSANSFKSLVRVAWADTDAAQVVDRSIGHLVVVAGDMQTGRAMQIPAKVVEKLRPFHK